MSNPTTDQPDDSTTPSTPRSTPGVMQPRPKPAPDTDTTPGEDSASSQVGPSHPTPPPGW